jgi:hypothetical protein
MSLKLNKFPSQSISSCAFVHSRPHRFRLIMSVPTTLSLTIPRERSSNLAWSRESLVRQMIVDHEVPFRCCRYIRKQVEQMINSRLSENYAAKKGIFRVQCQGTHLNHTALSDDNLSVFLIHNTDVPVREITKVLSSCTTPISAPESPTPQGNSVFHCGIVLPDLGSIHRWKGPETGQSRTFKCIVEIVQIPSSELPWEQYDVENIFVYNHCKVDISLVPEASRSIIYRLQLERFLKSFDLYALQITTILLRLMIRARGIDPSANGSYLSPPLIQLFVYRYHRDLCEQPRFVTMLLMAETIDHFNLARYVCYRMSAFDYRKLVWSLDGDVPSDGQRLRVLHPFYPECDVTQNWTAEKTREIMTALATVARVESVDEFIGNSRRSASDQKF